MKIKCLLLTLTSLLMFGCASAPEESEDASISEYQQTKLMTEQVKETSSEMEKDFGWLSFVDASEKYIPVEKADGYLHFYPSDSQSEISQLDGFAVLRNLSASAGFKVNSDKLNNEMKDQLDKVAETYFKRSKSHDKQLLVVTGHTDASGDWNYNINLSLRRAISAAKYLDKLGVPADSIVLIAGGPDYPLVDNSSRENKAKNRRVEILITADESFVTHLYRNYHCGGQLCQARSMEIWAYSRTYNISSDLRHLPSLMGFREELMSTPPQRNGIQVRRKFRKAPYASYIYRKFDITQYISE
ncbi:OmpA family protein [Photobacterium sp. ZSDE20]|uniref:OmpA family protein n=1 Tax=Photobacterium pectinilyticum TaxID=2906793 RepID=A0ABT1N2H6_9GAMM|nr:OmpA family protein [Photobacterium sp. ZSDE20]MCQ1057956.1 OmpA family protein [Photobacterium sp. ZSDE20]MDD1822488.1 OmpA family protein [Photobacterium sp. ZSDE20]